MTDGSQTDPYWLFTGKSSFSQIPVIAVATICLPLMLVFGTPILALASRVQGGMGEWWRDYCHPTLAGPGVFKAHSCLV